MIDLAERIVDVLAGVEVLLEDRVEDFLAKYGNKVPGSDPGMKRLEVERWLSKDPTYVPAVGVPGTQGHRPPRGGKYGPWMFREYAAGRTTWSDQELDLVHDAFLEFERLLSLPAFQGPRDIFQYNSAQLLKVTNDNRNLVSNSQLQRAEHEKKKKKFTPIQGQEGVTSVSEVGNITVLKITNADSLSWWAWRAYDADKNPNWKYATIPVGASVEQYRQSPPWPEKRSSPWCVRDPSMGNNYMRNEPDRSFYVVLKNGGPYVGILLKNGQAKDLYNHGIGLGIAEEIFLAMKPVLEEFKAGGSAFGSECDVFEQLRIVRGELKPGETIKAANLAGSSLKSLPDNLTVNGSLDVSSTKMLALPANLKVNGDLSMSGTKIKVLPPGLVVKGSLDIAKSKIKSLPQGMKIGKLNISGTKISQLPSGLDVEGTLDITNTPVTSLPNDLRAGQVLYTPELLPAAEIKRYFFWRRHDDLKAHFWKSNKVAGQTDEQKEAAWSACSAELLEYFQRADIISRAVTAMFKPVGPVANRR